MKLISVTPVRNEDWVVGLSLRALLKWVDEAVVLVHCCTDNTQVILEEIDEEHPGRVRILVEKDPTWREMAHRQRLLEEARKRGATHIATVDADEVLTANLLPVIRSQIEMLSPSRILHVPLPCLWGCIDRYRDDNTVWGIQTQRRVTVAVADAPHLHWCARNGYDHHQRHPNGAMFGREMPVGVGGLMHLQMANRRRLRAKHALYKIEERVRWPGKPVGQIDHMYSQALDERGCGTSAVPDSWWAGYGDLVKYLDLDQTREPWQEPECRRLVAEYGREKFAGLDLFGVA